jgi:hypothetical protein
MVIVFEFCVREAPSAGRDKKGAVVVVVLVFVVVSNDESSEDIGVDALIAVDHGYHRRGMPEMRWIPSCPCIDAIVMEGE